MNYVPSFSFTILSSSFYVPESLGQVQSYRFVRYDLSGCQSALQQPCQTRWQREKWVDYAELFWHVDCVRSLSLHAFSEKYRHFVKSRAVTSNKVSANHSTHPLRILSRSFKKCAIQGFGEDGHWQSQRSHNPC